MALNDEKIHLLAAAIYETRLLLSDYLGGCNQGDPNVREAAHLSYALHNAAQQILDGEDFDLDKTVNRIRSISNIIPGSDLPSRVLGDDTAD